MEKTVSDVQTVLDEVALKVVMLEADDIPALGMLLSDLDRLDASVAASDLPEAAGQLLSGVRIFTERLILGEVADTGPLENGITLLQEMDRASSRGLDWDKDLSSFFIELRGSLPSDQPQPAATVSRESVLSADAESKVACGERIFKDQDLEILADFVVESLESLENIEVRLIDLEEDPADVKILNDIFRPFHTIKGVAGFLDLFEINRLAHSTENLLDNARAGKTGLSQEFIDLILSSVDTLRALIGCVRSCLSNGGSMEACDVDIQPLMERMEQYKESPVSGRLGEILVKRGFVDEQAVEEGLKKQKIQGKPLGEILISEKKVTPKDVVSALRDQKRGRQNGNGKGATLQVKVDTAKLDNLVDLTGELVIAQAMLRQQALNQARDFSQNMGRLGQIVSDIQRLAMGMRMVQIGNTFQKMHRLVRELSRAGGKLVALEMSGQDTEIDRNVVETLYEPMVHMIRNAVDHGLERPEERRAAGKPEKGTILLKAYHKGGSIVLEMSDDGRGLDAEKIYAKGVERGIIAADAHLTKQEIFELIFHPGFSTAAAITDVSGRGVGMDVVKRVLETLRGRLDIHSEPKKGTTFVMALPLTMAIIDGMLVRVGRERYIIPTIAILESFRPAKKDIFTVASHGEMVMVRGSLVPLIRLGQVCGVTEDRTQPWEALVVVVENKERRRALLLDELLSKEEFVIKSMGETFCRLGFLAGAAILGDGCVGLILDMAGLFDMTETLEPAGVKGRNSEMMTEGQEEGR
ncbi:two-component system chemotaxis sensor kinase CheA [Desulfobotulus alkaliphilus]|uniref:Chemotaxis protein CheA n=1 Tax=Desulfobotulus alkaliphilus TaxID=622671 RepID=A0A562R4E8_9BACT|nr:chemotaxis protein CheA [Desulfobotulus alkaliphilus]TWI63929.1 two-component system chemotaxis sensor kinase CheA [Desulfobotulus alkaliphilus]